MSTDEQTPERIVRRIAGLRLDIAHNSRVLVSVPDVVKNAACAMVGSSPGRYVVLEMATLPGLRRHLQPGTTTLARYFSQGSIFSFSSDVLATLVRPPLLVLAYPDVVETCELRRHKRVNCLLPGLMHSRLGRHRISIRDLSTGGCRLVLEGDSAKRLSDVLERGDVVALEFMLQDPSRPDWISGHLRNKEREGEVMGLGVQFNPHARCRERIGEYLDALASRGGLR